MRLNKFLALCKVGSRRSSEELIRAGRITINGQVVSSLATTVASADVVRCDGQLLKPAEFRYILLNKPRGYITTRRDQFDRRAVSDLVPQALNPVGRLDADSTGVLLMTNDGELHFRLTHPRYQVVRTYRVTLAEPLTSGDLVRLQQGIEILPGKIARVNIKEVIELPDKTVVEMELREGLNREIRRLMQLLGKTILALDRIAYGGIGYGKLRRGAWRELAQREINHLYRLVGLL